MVYGIHSPGFWWFITEREKRYLCCLWKIFTSVAMGWKNHSKGDLWWLNPCDRDTGNYSSVSALVHNVVMSLHYICCKTATVGCALLLIMRDLITSQGTEGSPNNLCCPQMTTAGSGRTHRSRRLMSAPRILIYYLYGRLDCLLKYHVPNLSQFPADIQACEWKDRMLSAAMLSNVNVATVVKGCGKMAGGVGRKAATESE